MADRHRRLTVTCVVLAFLCLLSPGISATKASADAGHDAYNRGDFAEARKTWRKAAYSDPRAAFNLAILIETGQGGPADYKEAFKWYERAVEKGIMQARLELARIVVETGDISLFSKASMYIGRAVKTKEAQAIYTAGRLYEVQGIESKKRNIRRWYNPLIFAWGYYKTAAFYGGHPHAEGAARRVKEMLGSKYDDQLKDIVLIVRENIEGKRLTK